MKNIREREWEQNERRKREQTEKNRSRNLTDRAVSTQEKQMDRTCKVPLCAHSLLSVSMRFSKIYPKTHSMSLPTQILKLEIDHWKWVWERRM